MVWCGCCCFFEHLSLHMEMPLCNRATRFTCNNRLNGKSLYLLISKQLSRECWQCMLQAEQTCRHKRHCGCFSLRAFILASVLVSEFVCSPSASDPLHFCALVLAKPGISHRLAGDVIRPLLQWLAGIFPGYFSWCGSCCCLQCSWHPAPVHSDLPL